MFGNLSLYVAQEHTMAALKNIHQANTQYSAYNHTGVDPVSTSMFDQMYHQIPAAYQAYAVKDKMATGRADMHYYEAHRPLHFPSFHLNLPQRLPSPNRPSSWHQTTSVHQQAHMSLSGEQEPLQMQMGIPDKCPYIEEKKAKTPSVNDQDIPRASEMELIANKMWSSPAHSSIYYEPKASNSLTNWIYENSNLVLGKYRLLTKG